MNKDLGVFNEGSVFSRTQINTFMKVVVGNPFLHVHCSSFVTPKLQNCIKHVQVFAKIIFLTEYIIYQLRLRS